MNPLVIFGAGSIAKLAAWYFTHDSSFTVRAFCVDDDYAQIPEISGVPVLPFSIFCKSWPPQSCHVFVGLGYQQLNSLREKVCGRFRGAGYALASFVSSQALVLNENRLGDNCFIMPNVVLEPFSRVGSGCICWTGSIVAHESVVEDNCFMGAGSIIGGMSRLGKNSFLGINAIVQNGIEIGQGCLVGAGSVVRQNLPPDTMLAAPNSVEARIRASHAVRFIDL